MSARRRSTASPGSRRQRLLFRLVGLDRSRAATAAQARSAHTACRSAAAIKALFAAQLRPVARLEADWLRRRLAHAARLRRLAPLVPGWPARTVALRAAGVGFLFERPARALGTLTPGG
ncbi:hypothetical protein [Caldovatus aquaticus]|uniref:hypothetical protein n=1 Tax=Caldovatus aquaticus TaxID=2865671 RepID=UPI002106C4F3|nr:hypothetical protein [Caldovatus aquaticus]